MRRSPLAVVSLVSLACVPTPQPLTVCQRFTVECVERDGALHLKIDGAWWEDFICKHPDAAIYYAPAEEHWRLDCDVELRTRDDGDVPTFGLCDGQPVTGCEPETKETRL